jgi:hypothetical protein
VESPKKEWAEKLFRWKTGPMTTTTFQMGSMLPLNDRENLYLLRPIAVVGLTVPKELNEDDVLNNFKISQEDLAIYKSVMTEDERRMHNMVEYFYNEMKSKMSGNEEVERDEDEVWEEDPWPTAEEIIVIDE